MERDQTVAFFQQTLHHCEIELNPEYYILSWAVTLGLIKKGNSKAKLKKASDTYIYSRYIYVCVGLWIQDYVCHYMHNFSMLCVM